MSDDDGAYDSQEGQSEGENELTQYTREAINTEDIFEASIPEKHSAEKTLLQGRLPEMFEKMGYFLECDFNLLVYGVGSKRDVINKFAITMNAPYIVINGFHVGTTIKTVLNGVSKFISDLIFRKQEKNKRSFHS